MSKSNVIHKLTAFFAGTGLVQIVLYPKMQQYQERSDVETRLLLDKHTQLIKSLEQNQAAN